MTTTSINFSTLSTNATLLEEFFDPALDILNHYTRSSRDCPENSDEAFIRWGCLRTLSQACSGRDFLQKQLETFDESIKRSSFFDALHAPRRLRLLEEVSSELFIRRRQGLADLLAAFPELRDQCVLAGDGHSTEHACHALRDNKGRQVAPNSLYLLCLHSGLLVPLGDVQGNGVYRHEMPVFRRRIDPLLRRGSRFPKRVLFTLDPAFIDNGFWTQAKRIRHSGARMIVRAKSNVAPLHFQEHPWDREDPINLGVDTDQIVFFRGGIRMRLVQFADPETGQCHQFLTTDFELRPGVIAWLYLLRWRIEKAFDTAKNKLQETKAWATGTVAQNIQSHFLALTHNLLTVFRHKLEERHQIRDEKLERKRENHLNARDEVARARGLQLHPIHYLMPQIVQMSVQFIRSVRNQIENKARYNEALPKLRAMLETYL